MADLFLYGTLRHLPLLELVLGREDADVVPATLPGHRVAWAAGQSFPLISTDGAGGEAAGLLLRDLSEDDWARLNYYEGGFGYGTRTVMVQTAEGPVSADIYWPDAGLWEVGAPWELTDWADQWGRLTVEAAAEVMSYMGRIEAPEVARRFPFIRARAWSRILAQGRVAPQTLRSGAGAAQHSFAPLAGGYDGFFRLQPITAQHTRFDGSHSPSVNREAFIGFDASLILPYDPRRDLVLLIEQFRYGPAMRGDPCTRVLEPVAGMVDAGEDPAETARREAAEEAGLEISDIRPMTSVYASPGYVTDHFHCFLGLCDLDFETGRIGGHPDEDEDIRSHIISFDAAMDLVMSGEVNVAPLAMMLLWLGRKRAALRGN